MIGNIQIVELLVAKLNLNSYKKDNKSTRIGNLDVGYELKNFYNKSRYKISKRKCLTTYRSAQ